MADVMTTSAKKPEWAVIAGSAAIGFGLALNVFAMMIPTRPAGDIRSILVRCQGVVEECVALVKVDRLVIEARFRGGATAMGHGVTIQEAAADLAGKSSALARALSL